MSAMRTGFISHLSGGGPESELLRRELEDYNREDLEATWAALEWLKEKHGRSTPHFDGGVQ